MNKHFSTFFFSLFFLSIYSINIMTNILIGATGSIAAIKIPLLVDFFQKHPYINVKVVVTESAHFFVKDMEINCPVYREQDEWNEWKKIADPILHIELRNWADIMIIAPLDANTLGKLANGLCDNLLTCVLRAWDVNKPVVACPAMNTSMWHHPLTEKHLQVLETLLNYKIIQPISKKLACGDTGVGAMAESQYISDYVLEMINGKGLAGLTVEDVNK
ncbi:hypothetical protein PS15m_010274 [Mucor circinelloides]